MNSRWICFVGLFAVPWLAGCTPAPTTGQVSGKVSVAGKGPLTGGTIIFVSAADAKRAGTGTIKPDGTYDVPNAPLGECKVTVDNLSLKGTAAMGAPPPSVSGQTGAVPKGLEIPTGMGAMGKGTYIPIDPTFAKPESTSLKASVNKGTNTADFEVK
jgi:hypothetical protein